MDSYLLKKKYKEKRERWETKDMSKKLVSKPDVMSSSGVMYLYVSKIFLTQLTKPLAAKILSMN